MIFFIPPSTFKGQFHDAFLTAKNTLNIWSRSAREYAGIPVDEKTTLALICAGGTFGAKADDNGENAKPLTSKQFQEKLEEYLKKTKLDQVYNIDIIHIDPIDSTKARVKDWNAIGSTINKLYKAVSPKYKKEYDGFVVIHGTDTLEHTSSALTFMLQNLGKPVVITGAMKPFVNLVTDAKDNLCLALKAASKKSIKEVVVAFGDQIFKGNGITKLQKQSWNPFVSPAASLIKKAGFLNRIRKEILNKPRNMQSQKPWHTDFFYVPMDETIELASTVTQEPDTTVESLERLYDQAKAGELKGMVFRTYADGNIRPELKEVLERINEDVVDGMPVIAVTQPLYGCVTHNYEVSGADAVISGHSMRTPCAKTKMRHVITVMDQPDVWDCLEVNLAGETSVPFNQLSPYIQKRYDDIWEKYKEAAYQHRDQSCEVGYEYVQCDSVLAITH